MTNMKRVGRYAKSLTYAHVTVPQTAYALYTGHVIRDIRLLIILPKRNTDKIEIVKLGTGGNVIKNK
jgi:hypothetical protein